MTAAADASAGDAAPRRRRREARAPRGTRTALDRGRVGASVGLGLLVSGPLVLGGAPPWARLVVLGLAALGGALVFAATRTHEPSRLRREAGLGRGARVLVLGLALTACVAALQLLPLPCGLPLGRDALRLELPARLATLHHVAPRCPISVDPPSTAAGLALDLTCILAVLAGVRARRVLGTQSSALPLAIGLALPSLVTLVHAVFEARSVYGLYAPTHATGPLVGPLLNANHVAALATLTLPVAVVGLRDDTGGRRAAAGLAALAAVVVAVLSRSRAGLVVFAGTLLVSAFLARPTRRSGTVAVPVAVVALFGVAFAAALGADDFLRDLRESPYKTELLRDGLQLGREAWPLGHGAGAFAQAFAAHATPTGRAMFAENLLNQAMIELGPLVGVASVLLPGLALLSALRPSRPHGTKLLALAVLATMVHDLADFALLLPGLRIAAAAVAGVALGATRLEASSVTHEPTHGDTQSRPRAVAPVVVGLVLVALVAAGYGFAYDVERMRNAVAASLGRPTAAASTLGAALTAASSHPQEPELLVLATLAAAQADDARALPLANLARRVAPRWSTPSEALYPYLARAGRSAQAVAELGRIARAAPARVASVYCAAPVSLSSERFAAAMPSPEAGVRAVRELGRCLDPRARLRLARALSARFPADAAAEALALELTLVALGPTDARGALRDSAPRSRAAMLVGIDVALAAGDVPTARALVGSLQRRDPAAAATDVELAGRAARVHARAGERDAAMAALATTGRGLARAPQLVLEAEVHEALGDFVEAAEALELAYRIDPQPSLLAPLERVARAAGLVGKLRFLEAERARLAAEHGLAGSAP